MSARSVVPPFLPARAAAVSIVIALSAALPTGAAARASAASAKAPAVPAPERGPVDANRADATALQAVPGIGPAIAARIVAERERRPFVDLDDFDDRVKGVGEATLRRMVAGGLVVVAPPPVAARGANARPPVVQVAGGRTPIAPLGRVIHVADPGDALSAGSPDRPGPAAAARTGGMPVPHGRR